MRYTTKLAGLIAAACIAGSAGAQPHAHAATTAASDSARTIQSQFASSTALASVLDRSCGDCHSNVMKSAWFTRMPPFSTIMSRAAKDGRKVVNFAEWSSYTPEQQRAFLLASCADAKSGKMPVGSYLKFRGDARLSADDVNTICSAAEKAP